MSYAAAITALKTITFTGLANSYSVVDRPPSPPELPALVIDDVSQPFTEGLTTWNVTATLSNFICYIDHVLLIEPINDGTYSERYTNITTYIDRYLGAINDNMKLTNNLAVPLILVIVERGSVFVRKREYSGIRFRHKWEIRVT